MTSVLFLLWLSDFVANIGVCGVFAMFALIILLVFSLLDEDYNSRKYKKHWIICFVVVGLAIITPSKTTMQLIATNQMKDVILDSKLGNKAVDAMNAILDKIISEKQKM